MLKKIRWIIFISLFALSIIESQNLNLNEYRWTTVETINNVTGRHENAFVEFKGKFYLIGGRGINPVDIYDPKTNIWTSKNKSPIEIHHFQPVVYGDAIYLMGAMTGGYPNEIPLTNIWLYYPEEDRWEEGDEIPITRRRGGAGAVLYNNKIYVVCGIDYGHTSGTNNYFDSYDLKTGEWKVLTKAPHIRDHFPAIIVGDKLYCVGGRNTSFHYEDNFGAFFDATIPYVDCYDFTTDKWYTLKNKIPFPTAAGGIVNIGDKIIYSGGEGEQKQAYNQSQCLDLKSGEWSQLAPMNIGRHGSSTIFFNTKIYIAAGSQNQGGGNMSSMEVFSWDHNWKTLFNGKNLDGWEVKCVEKDKDKKYWFVVNGVIVCDTKGNYDHKYMWLQSDEEYDDFELRLKFQASRENKGNSGVQIRSCYYPEAEEDGEGELAGWLDGPQVDIDPNNPWRTGLIYDETRETRRWINPSLEDSRIDSAKYAAKKFIHYFEDEESGWNDMTIICKGMVIKTYVNNLLVSDYDGTGLLDDKAHIKYNVGSKGHIALQLHKHDINKMKFKDIEIREIE